MGRPINPNYIGNITGTGQTLELTAWIPGDLGTCTAWVIGQRTTNGYNVANSIGISSGLVYLANGGVSLTQGTANVTVKAYGSSGSGATAVANLGVNSATANIGGSGGETVWYTPGDLLSVSGGTRTQVANLTVSTVKIGATVGSGGPGYTVGDTFTWSYTGYNTPPVLTVASTTGNGNISGVTISTAGAVSNVLVSNTTPYTSSTQANAWATGASFALRWDVNQLSVTTHGDYSVQPANSVSFANNGTHGGTGATANLAWQVSSVDVLVPGSGYQAVTVNFSNSTASAIGTVNAAGNVSAVSITVPGSGIAPGAAPAVSISTLRNTEYASKITNLLVETFQGNTYLWVDSATAVTASNQAQLQTG